MTMENPYFKNYLKNNPYVFSARSGGAGEPTTNAAFADCFEGVDPGPSAFLNDQQFAAASFFLGFDNPDKTIDAIPECLKEIDSESGTYVLQSARSGAIVLKHVESEKGLVLCDLFGNMVFEANYFNMKDYSHEDNADRLSEAVKDTQDD
jgi:hypothetical protein